jgi:hypothetical protein
MNVSIGEECAGREADRRALLPDVDFIRLPDFPGKQKIEKNVVISIS